MPEGWRSRLKTTALTAAITAAVTAALTSLLWIAAGLWWYVNYYRLPPPAPPLAEAGEPALRIVERAATTPLRAPSSTVPGKLLIPVAGVKPGELVDTFAQARAGGVRRHDAIDIMAPLGTRVLAAAAGTVEKLFLSDAGGKTMFIRSPDGRRIYYYAHLDAYAPGIEEGDAVRQGQQIGTVGYTGNAHPEGPHLHFEVMATTPDRKWYEEKSILNPYPLLTGG